MEEQSSVNKSKMETETHEDKGEKAESITGDPASTQKITLTVPTAMIDILEREKEKYIYHNIQELILEAVRDKYVRNLDRKGQSKRGRPKKVDHEKFLKRKKIFVKKGGENIDV